MKSKSLFIGKYLAIGMILAIVLYFFIAPSIVYLVGRNKVFTSIHDVEKQRIAIVLGAAVTPEGEPRDMLKDRLDLAADLYFEGEIEKILITGDENAAEKYDEPAAMYKYLIESREIPEEIVVKDVAGKRTYDSCARAKEVYGIDSAILISQGYHLPRAIFLCNNLGVDATGLSATLHNKYDGEYFFKVREFFALHKAIWDIYVDTPDYLKSDFIDIWQ